MSDDKVQADDQQDSLNTDIDTQALRKNLSKYLTDVSSGHRVIRIIRPKEQTPVVMLNNKDYQSMCLSERLMSDKKTRLKMMTSLMQFEGQKLDDKTIQPFHRVFTVSAWMHYIERINSQRLSIANLNFSVIFSDSAFSDYQQVARNDREAFFQANRLIGDILNVDTTNKPDQLDRETLVLSGLFAGYSAISIKDRVRVIYKLDTGDLTLKIVEVGQ